MINSINKKRNWPLAFASAAFLIALTWFGTNLDFSAYAHPDERNKISQVVERHYNFHHPLLMLNAVRLFSEGIGRGSDFEFVKLSGRWTSVIFSSISVALLVLISGRLFGGWVAFAAGIFLLTNPHLFDLAHYFKEDPALLFGVSLLLFSMLVFSEHPGVLTAIFVGISSACAVSGKYAGALMIPFSIFLVLAYSKSRVRDLVLMLLACGLGFVLLNFPAFVAMGAASGSLDREIGLLTGADKEVARSIPHGVYSNVYWQSSTPFLVGLLVIYGMGLVKRRFRLSPYEWVLILLPIVYILILSFLSKTNHRYFLPAAALLACLSAAGVEQIIKINKGKWIVILLIAGSVAWQAPRLSRAYSGFTEHHQTEALEFIRTKLPLGSKIMEDRRVYFPPYDDKSIVRRNVAPDDTLENLSKEGFTHIIVTSRMYGGFFKESSKPIKEIAGDFEKIKRFYADLFERGTLLKEWPMGGNQYLANPLRIYSIKNPKAIDNKVL